MSVDWVGYGYAALIATGGVVGYAKAGKWVLLDVKVMEGSGVTCFSAP